MALFILLTAIVLAGIAYSEPGLGDKAVFIYRVILYFTAVVMVIYDTIQTIIFSKRTFACLNCGHNYKPKWFRLWFFSWRSPRKYRTYKELSTGKCERIHYRCPECKTRDCVIIQAETAGQQQNIS